VINEWLPDGSVLKINGVEVARRRFSFRSPRSTRRA
jgi:hypothetical protein